MITSFNDLLIVKPYAQGQGLKSEVKSGFAFVSQKSKLAGLELLVDAKLNDGSFISKGCTVFIAEDQLATMPWAKDIKTSQALDSVEFIVVPLKSIVLIQDKGI